MKKRIISVLLALTLIFTSTIMVFADEVVTGAMDGISKEWNLNGEDVTIGVKRL